MWVDPDRIESREQAKIPVTFDGTNLNATFPLGNGVRKWMITTLPKEASLAMLTQENLFRAPPPQKFMVKHGHFPLDLLKDYVYLPRTDETHPRLFIKQEDLRAVRKNIQTDTNRVAQLIRQPVSLYQMEDWIEPYLTTGDSALGKHMAETAAEWMQQAVDAYLDQDSPAIFGLALGHGNLFIAANLADVVLDTDAVTPEMRRRFRAQTAFLGYTADRADFWSPARGFSANPNMTTAVAAYKCVAACMLPQHPQAATWMKHAMADLKFDQLDTWSDSNGGWLEAPHYALTSFDYLLGCFLMARNSGFNDHVFDPRMKKVAEWFAKTSTPPDSRAQGHRHLPPIGNTCISEKCGQFAQIAWVWRQRDPAFASEMQWMYRQQGSFPKSAIGGFNASLAGYRTMMYDPAIPARAPAYKSELFPQTCVMLRHGFPTDRETQLLLLTERVDHYDYDTGSITLWGKGRIIADDFGYYGRAPVEDHSMIETPIAAADARMRVQEHSFSEDFDYVRAVKEGWTRQIAFVKSADPLGPNYFVVNDSFRVPAPATWRLWLTADKVTPKGQTATVAGKEDVDLDVFFTRPTPVELKTEQKTLKSVCGINVEGREGPVTTTQTGLIATVQRGRGFSAVLYPRLKSEKPPTFTSLADGKAVKVETEAGTDYMFLSDQSFSFQDGDIAFEGTIGAVRLRGQHGTLSLGATGSIAASGHALKSRVPARKQW